MRDQIDLETSVANSIIDVGIFKSIFGSGDYLKHAGLQ